MTNYTWQFSCIDNGGLYQYFRVKAPDKTKAIKKAFHKANRRSKGDIINWECNLVLGRLTSL